MTIIKKQQSWIQWVSGVTIRNFNWIFCYNIFSRIFFVTQNVNDLVTL